MQLPAYTAYLCVQFHVNIFDLIWSFLLEIDDSLTIFPNSDFLLPIFRWLWLFSTWLIEIDFQIEFVYYQQEMIITIVL